jgi:hypothetical protein
VTALPGHNPLDHLVPDQEKLLRRFGAWQQEWDEPQTEETENAFIAQVRFAIQCYKRGLTPLEVRWELAEQFGRRCRIIRVEKAAQRALVEASKAPRETQLALVAIQRATVIQEAMKDRQWGPALRGIDRQGDVLGELNPEAGLSADDLRLVVEIEGDDPPLPAGEGEPIQGEQEQAEAAETEA